MTPRQYKVIGECAHCRTVTAAGPQVIMYMKGHVLPPDAPQKTIDHLLMVGLIEPVEPVGGVEATPAPVAEPVESATRAVATATEPVPELPEPDADPSPATEADADIETRREIARAKLPTDGSLPTRRHGQQVWVEAAVQRGYDRVACEGASKDELIGLLGAEG